MGQLTFEQKETNARNWLDRHVQTPDHQLHLCSDACHYLTWALFELDNMIPVGAFKVRNEPETQSDKQEEERG
jgi:hypothetical protein